MGAHRLLAFVLTLLFLAAPTGQGASAEQAVNRGLADWTGFAQRPKEDKALALNLAVGAGILAWGTVSWDYGERSPNFRDEGWFGHGTDNGGADKLGHFWTGYTLSHLFAGQYQRWGYADDEAARLGALSSFGATTLVELGDSFSNFGFSYQDFLFNTLGAGIGYLWWRDPDLARKIDFRTEYNPFRRGDIKGDVFTDYDRTKYLIAVKAEGFDAIENPYLRLLELHAGYYSRGYADWTADSPVDDRRRYYYVGIGINVGRLLRPVLDTSVFNYLQVPYTYVPARQGLE